MSLAFKYFHFLVIVCLALSSCSEGRVRTWADDQVSTGNYGHFEIKPVFNATGKSIAADVPLLITEQLRTQFTLKNLPLGADSQSEKNSLIVRSDILNYIGCEITATPGIPDGGGPFEKSMCSLRAQLIDKASGKVFAEIYTTKTVPGCSLGHKHQRLFEEIATDIANEVAKLLAGS